MRVPHLVHAQRPYEIVREIVSAAIDYGNFITDMVADRPFIEDNTTLCSEGNHAMSACSTAQQNRRRARGAGGWGIRQMSGICFARNSEPIILHAF